MTNLMAARVTLDRRYGLLNNKLSIHVLNGESQHTTLATATELRGTLEHLFGIEIPDDPGMEALLTRLAAGSGLVLVLDVHAVGTGLCPGAGAGLVAA